MVRGAPPTGVPPALTSVKSFFASKVSPLNSFARVAGSLGRWKEQSRKSRGSMRAAKPAKRRCGVPLRPEEEMRARDVFYGRSGGVKDLEGVRAILYAVGQNLITDEVEDMCAEIGYTPGSFLQLCQFEDMLRSLKERCLRDRTDPAREAREAFSAVIARADSDALAGRKEYTGESLEQRGIPAETLKSICRDFSLMIDIDGLLMASDGDADDVIDLAEFRTFLGALNTASEHTNVASPLSQRSSFSISSLDTSVRDERRSRRQRRGGTQQAHAPLSVGLERVSLVGASGVSQTRRGPLLNHDWPARRPAADTPEPDGPPTGLAPVPTLGQLCLSERSDLHEPKSADRSGLPLSPAVEEAKSGREQAGSPGEEQEEEAETEEPQLDRSTEPSRSNFEEAVAVAGGKQRVILRAAMRQRGPLSSSGTSPTRERRRGRRRQRWRVNGQSDAATSPTTASAGDAASESSVEDADELPPPRAPPQWGNDASASSSECGPRAEQAMEELAGACRDVALDGSTQSSSAATPAARTPEDSGRRSAPSRAWAGGSPTDEQRTATPARLRRLPPQKAEVSEGLLRVRRRRELRRAAEQKWRTLICEEQPSDAWLLSQTSVAVCMPRTAAEDMLCAAPLLAPSHRARSCKPRRGPTPVTVGRLRQSSTVLSAGSRLAAGLDWAGQESKRNGAALWDEGSGEESETEGAAAETPTEQSAWSPVECGTVTGPLTPAAAQDDQSAVPSWEDLPHQAQSDFRESLAASALFSAKAKKAERRWSAAPRKSASRVPSQRRSLLRPRVASFDVPLHESELLEQSGFGTPCGFPHTAAR